MRTSTLFFVAIFSTAMTQAQWHSIGAEMIHYEEEICLSLSAVNDSVLWFTSIREDGDVSNRIFRTTDAGASFDEFNPGFPDSNFVSHAVFALSEDLAWVSRWQVNIRQVKVIKTEDGGQSWTEQHFNTDNFTEIYGLHFYDEQNGFVFGKVYADGEERLYFFFTTDGGAQWTRLEEFPAELNEIQWLYNAGGNYSVVGNWIFIPTSEGKLLVSNNRGQSWEVRNTPVPMPRPANSVAFRDSLNGLLLAVSDDAGKPFHPEGPLGYRTDDGGLSWESIQVPRDIETLAYVPGSGGVYVGMRGALNELYYYISRDEGISWQELSSQPLRNIEFTATGEAWAVGNTELGGVYRWEGSDLTASTESISAQMLPYFEGFEEGHPEDYFLEAMGGVTEYDFVLIHYIDALGVPEHGNFAGIAYNNQPQPFQRIITAPIELPAEENLRLSFESFFVDVEDDEGYEKATVLISIDSMASWDTVYIIDPLASLDDWILHEVDLSAYAGTTVRLAFNYEVVGYGFGLFIDDISVDITTDTYEEELINEIRAFPNPTQDKLSLHLGPTIGGYYFIKLLDMQGKLIKEFQATSTYFNLNLKDCSPGLYYLSIQNEEGKRVQKIIKL